MKFSELNPQMVASSTPGVNDLSFICPRCGHPRVVSIRVRPGDHVVGVWGLKGIPENPNPGDPMCVRGWDGITINPSVQNHRHGRLPCGWHGSIINGEVTTV